MFPLNGRRVADIGCGVGTWLLEFIQWGVDPADVGGIDLMPERLERARRRIPRADLHLGNASELPWPDESFDLVSQFLVFTNIFDPELKHAVANEMLRILKPGGVVLWFDLRVNNPRNPEVRGLRRAEIRTLFPSCEIELIPALLAPPLGRLIAGWSWPFAEALHALPFLCTHYAGLISKPRYKETSTEKSAGLPGQPAPNRIL
jgi:ubiquinone/menaquinone biosynthesis C-methylase UbiE